ncbi:MAG: histidinol dehydrogenase, partial [Actinomycetota bacterium]|nr:histidinol dehydrogenase [Actinomycetota bacterium]
MLPRAEVDIDAVIHQVTPVIDAVRTRGVDAVLDFTERFDGVRPASVRVPPDLVQAELERLDPAVRVALEEAIARVRRAHSDQRRTETVTQVVPGGTVTQRWIPVARVGLYAPGGLAVYPSTVVMNVVPAQVAGVTSLVVCSPPQAGSGDRGGRPHPT